MRSYIKRTAVAATGSLALLAGCKDSTSVPDLNNVSSATITNGLNASSVQLLVTGILASERRNLGFGAIVSSGTMARDVYNLDPAENRYINELLGVPIDPSAFTGGASWTPFYQTIRTSNTLLDNLSTARDLTTQQQSAIKGLIRTVKALQYYRVLQIRGTNGAAIDVNRPITADPAPIICYAPALAAVSALLDSAYADLQAGGTQFPVTIPAGFTLHGSFDTPATYARYNRALKGAVEVYRGLAGRTQSFTDAITALNASFLDVNGDMQTGIWYTYSTASGELTLPIAANTIYLNPAVGDSIAAGDLRRSKITTIARVTRYGVSTTYQSPITAPGNLTNPLPSLRNAELILLRAQAEIGLGQLDKATADLNVVRQKEGGLAPYATFTSTKAAVDALLYEKRYSLLLSGPQRLADLRAYGRLNAANFKKEIAADEFNSQLPIPKGEADLRNGNVACVNQ